MTTKMTADNKKLDVTAHIDEYDSGAEDFKNKGENLSTWIYIGAPIIDKFANSFANIEDATFLVQGSGNGRDAERLIARGVSPQNITGIEISPVEVQNAQQAIPEATFIVGSLTKVNYPQKIDAAQQHMVCEHLDNETLAEVNRRTFEALKPGGKYLVIGTHPEKTAINSGLTESGSYVTTFPWGGEGLNYHRSKNDFINAYEDAGFVIDSVQDLNLPEEAAETHPEDVERYKKYPYLRVAITMHKPETTTTA